MARKFVQFKRDHENWKRGTVDSVEEQTFDVLTKGGDAPAKEYVPPQDRKSGAGSSGGSK